MIRQNLKRDGENTKKFENFSDPLGIFFQNSEEIFSDFWILWEIWKDRN